MTVATSAVPYTVYPHPAPGLTAEEIRLIRERHFDSAVVGCGTVAFVIALVLVVAALVTQPPLAICPAIAILASFFWFLNEQTKYEQDLQGARDEKARAAEREATEVTWRGQSYLHTISAAGSQISQNLADVVSSLETSEFEFNNHAYSPFWDAMESAALQLNTINEALAKIEQTRAEYATLLANRQHTFPQVTINIDQSALTRPIEQLRSLLRRAQTDYHFTMVLEQRKTRHVLIAGFTTIAEAVNTIGDKITKAMKVLTRRW